MANGKQMRDKWQRYGYAYEHLLGQFGTEKEIHIVAYRESGSLELTWDTKGIKGGIKGGELLNEVLNTQRQWLQLNSNNNIEELIRALNYFVTQAQTHCTIYQTKRCIVKPAELVGVLLEDHQWFYTWWMACSKSHNPKMFTARSAIGEAVLLSELLKYLNTHILEFLGVIQRIDENNGWIYVLRPSTEVHTMLLGDLDLPQPSPVHSQAPPAQSASAGQQENVLSLVNHSSTSPSSHYDQGSLSRSPSPGTPPLPGELPQLFALSPSPLPDELLQTDEGRRLLRRAILDQTIVNVDSLPEFSPSPRTEREPKAEPTGTKESKKNKSDREAAMRREHESRIVIHQQYTPVNINLIHDIHEDGYRYEYIQHFLQPFASELSQEVAAEQNRSAKRSRRQQQQHLVQPVQERRLLELYRRHKLQDWGVELDDLCTYINKLINAHQWDTLSLFLVRMALWHGINIDINNNGEPLVNPWLIFGYTPPVDYVWID